MPLNTSKKKHGSHKHLRTKHQPRDGPVHSHSSKSQETGKLSQKQIPRPLMAKISMISKCSMISKISMGSVNKKRKGEQLLKKNPLLTSKTNFREAIDEKRKSVSASHVLRRESRPIHKHPAIIQTTKRRFDSDALEFGYEKTKAVIQRGKEEGHDASNELRDAIETFNSSLYSHAEAILKAEPLPEFLGPYIVELNSLASVFLDNYTEESGSSGFMHYICNNKQLSMYVTKLMHYLFNICMDDVWERTREKVDTIVDLWHLSSFSDVKLIMLRSMATVTLPDTYLPWYLIWLDGLKQRYNSAEFCSNVENVSGAIECLERMVDLMKEYLHIVDLLTHYPTVENDLKEATLKMVTVAFAHANRYFLTPYLSDFQNKKNTTSSKSSSKFGGSVTAKYLNSSNTSKIFDTDNLTINVVKSETEQIFERSVSVTSDLSLASKSLNSLHKTKTLDESSGYRTANSSDCSPEYDGRNATLSNRRSSALSFKRHGDFEMKVRSNENVTDVQNSVSVHSIFSVDSLESVPGLSRIDNSIPNIVISDSGLDSNTNANETNTRKAENDILEKEKNLSDYQQDVADSGTDEGNSFVEMDHHVKYIMDDPRALTSDLITAILKRYTSLAISLRKDVPSNIPRTLSRKTAKIKRVQKESFASLQGSTIPAVQTEYAPKKYLHISDTDVSSLSLPLIKLQSSASLSSGPVESLSSPQQSLLSIINPQQLQSLQHIKNIPSITSLKQSTRPLSEMSRQTYNVKLNLESLHNAWSLYRQIRSTSTYPAMYN